MDNIRVTYSGLLGFAVAMGSVLAGLIFVVIVTRQLTPEEFGVWAIIGSMVSYSTTSETIINYWVTRQVARKKPVGKTAVVSASLFTGGSIPIYVLSVYLFYNIESTFSDLMLLGAILVPMLFIQSIISAVNLGYRPHAVSISMATFQAVKIPAGLALVFFLELGLEGAILSVFVAHLANIAVQLRYVRLRLAVPLNFSYLIRWIKQSWIPLYGRIPKVLNMLDIIIYTVIVGSVVGVAYYAAALVMARIVSRAGHISQALYPKLLADGSRDHIVENFTWMIYFSVPLVILAGLFSRYGMFLLNPEYIDAWAAGVLLALSMFLRVIMAFLRQVLMGIDDVDIDERPSVSALLKSKLFLVGTIENVYYATYLVVLVVSLYTFLHLPEPELVSVWALVMLAVSIPFLIYYVILVRNYAPFLVPYKSILRYTIGGASMTAVFIFTNEHVVTLDVSIYSYLPGLLLEVAVCCGTYLGITYIIDRKTRMLCSAILSEMVSRIKN